MCLCPYNSINLANTFPKFRSLRVIRADRFFTMPRVPPPLCLCSFLWQTMPSSPRQILLIIKGLLHLSHPPKAFPDLPPLLPFSCIVKCDFHHLGIHKTCGCNSLMGHIFSPFTNFHFYCFINLLKVLIAMLKYYRRTYNQE